MLTLNQLGGFGAGGAAELPPPLDLIATSPTGAYSLRRLRAAFAGSAIQAKLTGGSTQDVGFVGNDFNGASALSFAAGATAGVATWYDQSGNARNLTTSTFAQEPTVCASGALFTSLGSTGKPTVKYDGSSSRLTTATALSNFITAAAWTVFSVARANSSSSNSTDPSIDPQVFSDNSGYMCAGAFGSTGPQIRFSNYDGTQDNVGPFSYTYGTSVLMLAKYDGTNVKGYVGGGAGQSTASGNTQQLTGTIVVGAGRNVVNFLDGNLSELLIFNAALSAADCNTIANNIAAYYGLSWSNIS